MEITLTEKAAKQVRKQLEKRGSGLGLRIGVRTSGCSGMAYVLEYVDNPEDDDISNESHGVKVFFKLKNKPYLDGVQLDFVREGLNEGFKFLNPNEKASCGCGESFAV